MTLSTDQQMLIEQRVANDGKSTVVAYLLLFFVGFFGAHRFYLGRTKSGVAMLVLSLIGFVTTAILIGFVILLAVGIWAFVDIFIIPGMIEEQRNALRSTLSAAEADKEVIKVE